jgi:hypothetical protein
MAEANAVALRDMSKDELVKHAVRWSSQLKSMKAEIAHGGKIVAHTGLAALGGAAAGVLAVKMPKVPFLPHVDTDIALGAGLSLLAAMDLFDGADEWLNSLASGLIAAGVARETQAALLARAAAPKAA